MEWVRQIVGFLGGDTYYRHAICLTNDPAIIVLYVLGDLTVWASYMVIGLSLGLTFSGSMRLSRTATVLFGAFIFLCGLTHLTKTLTMFAGVYYLDLATVLVTASVSAVTAGYTAREAIADLWSR